MYDECTQRCIKQKSKNICSLKKNKIHHNIETHIRMVILDFNACDMPYT